jgi:signal transduction histidine kinase
MRFILCVFGFIFYFEARAQNLKVVDSLKSELPTASPEREFALLNALGFEYRYSFPDSTIYYCLQAYDRGKGLHLPKLLSKPLSFIGLAHASKGDYEQSLDYHYRSIEVAIEQNDSLQLAYAYNNLGRMFLDLGDQARAYDNLVRSKELFEILKDKPGLAYVYRSLANVYKSQKECTKAIEMSTRAVELRKQLGNPRDLASAYMELGLVYQSMQEPKTALAKLAMADSIEARINDKVTKAEIRLGMAEILFEEKEYQKAFEAATYVLQTISASTNRKLFLRSSLICGKYYFQKGEYDKAIPLLGRIVSDENTGAPYFQRDASNVLYEIYKRRKDSARVNVYLTKYNILNERLQNQELNNQIERLLFQLQIEKKEKENELLKANQLKIEATIAKQRSQNILLLIVLISLGGLAVMLWTASRGRRVINRQLVLQNQQIDIQRIEITRQNENLSRRNLELSELNNEKDTLMNIVAHDLKSPLNSISGLALVMEAEGDLPEHHKEVVDMIKDSTHAGLEMITDLLDVNALEAGGNPQYSSFDLGKLLKEKIQAFHIQANSKEIMLTSSNSNPDPVRSDPDYVSRILDNLLSNAIKFSEKSSVISVSGSRLHGQVVIAVKDEGPGFSEQDKKLIFQKFKKLSARPTGGESSNGLGLAIVKILVDRLGGEIELKTGSGTGSEFIIRIPDQSVVGNQ